ncbi:hypothetical protein BSKO_00007 [Bryopsis sp. KO-2023]|nr:hypothetical protein BSKO_00007 [Bryopsis sp. KO-2023]
MGKSALKFLREGVGEKASQKEDNAQPITSLRPQADIISGEGSYGSHWPLEDVGLFELRSLLLKDCEVANSPKTTIFGMSPPTRGGPCGGAYNPLTLDRNWHRQARFAVQHNLQALRERDLQGGSCLRTSSVGDPRLLTTSPDYIPIRRNTFAVGASENSTNTVPFTCQTRYFEPQKIK